MTAIHATTDHVGHKLYMKNFFLSPALYDDSHTKTIFCFRTVRPNGKEMQKTYGHKMKMKKGKQKTNVKGKLTAIVRKDK